MRKFLFGAFAFGFACLLSSSAHAGSLATHLSFDGTIDVLDDDSVSFVADRDGSASISVGDIVFGVIRIAATTANGVLPADDQLIGVFSFEVTASTGAPGGDPTVTISNFAGTDPLDGTGLSIDELFGTAFGTSAGVAVLSSHPNPVNITTLTPAGAIAALGGYSLDAILGFGSAADYLEIQSFRDFDDSGELDFSEFPAPSPAGTFLASEAGGLSVLSHTMGGGTVFLPVASTHLDGSTITTHDVGISGTLFGRRSDTAAGWSITDSTALAVNAVPEPSSMILLGMGLAGMGGFGFRRRKTKKVAA